MEFTQTHQNTSLVIIGAWNPRILTPKWMSGGRLTDAKNIGIQIAFDQSNIPLRYLFDDIILVVSESQLIISSTKSGNDILQSMEAKAVKICEELFHTPVTAFGVNFQYKSSSKDAELFKQFNTSYHGKYSDGGHEILKTSFTHTLKMDNNFINIGHLLDEDDQIFVDVNYHHPVQTTKEIVDIISGKVIDYQNKSNSILESLGYKLTE